MAIMLGIVRLAGDELIEGCFIHPFVDVDSTFGAFQAARGFGKVTCICGWLLICLVCQQILDALGSRGFLGGWLRMSSIRTCGQSSCSLVSRTLAVKPWCILVPHAVHWYPLR